MFDSFRIRTKLIAIVAAPLAALLVVAAIGVSQRRDDAASTRRDAARITVTERAATVGHQLQLESSITAAVLLRGDTVDGGLKAQRVKTDQAIRQFTASLGDLGKGDKAVATGTIRAASGQFEFLPSLREQSDRGETAWSEIASQYEIVDDALLQVSGEYIDDITDPELGATVQNLAALTALKSAVARESVLLTGVFDQQRFSDRKGVGSAATGEDLRAKFDEIVANQEIQEAVFLAGASPAGRTQFRNSQAGASVDFIEEARLEAVEAKPGATLTVNPRLWRTASLETLNKLRSIESGTAAAMLATAAHNASSASSSARLYLVLALLVLLLVLVLAAVVSASITRPLGKLTVAVDWVAQEQLPRLVESLKNPAEDDIRSLAHSLTDIEVGGGRELVHLGAAVNSIQQVAVDVATEQATLLRKGIGDMFVNLARRNQGLLDRQIEYIDQLESDEEDPDQLEALFKLDHMATRMRRNAESLLVLAGAEPTRRRGRPVPMTDVALAAVGEVEDYSRLELLTFDDGVVKSAAALDIAHLLSELMENATHFSPPDSRVEIAGQRDANEYVVSVTDHGIGMTPEQMAEANELLASPPLVGLALSRSLGFIVIGRLAARFDIAVRLRPTSGGGVTASVSLPASMVVDPSSTSADPALDSVEARVDAGVDARPDPLAAVTSISAASPLSVLPPLEYTFFDQEQQAPDTLDESLPRGDAFEEGLAGLIEPEGSDDQGGDPDPFFDQEAPPSFGGDIDPAQVAFGMNARSPFGDLPDGAIAPPLASDGAAARAELFGPSWASSSATPTSPLPEPLPSSGEPVTGPRLFGSVPTTDTAPTDGAAPPTEAAGERTASGLVRRQPRGTDAGARRLPGSDGPARSATTSQRSPEEVRTMLAQFRSGRKKGEALKAEPGDVDPETDPNTGSGPGGHNHPSGQNNKDTSWR